MRSTHSIPGGPKRGEMAPTAAAGPPPPRRKPGKFSTTRAPETAAPAELATTPPARDSLGKIPPPRPEPPAPPPAPRTWHYPDKNGRAFVPRGVDHIARGSTKLLLGQVFLDNREFLYDGCSEIAQMQHGPNAFLSLVGMIADRTEGKPLQTVQTTSRRTTNFLPAAPGPGNTTTPASQQTFEASESHGGGTTMSPVDGMGEVESVRL